MWMRFAALFLASGGVAFGAPLKVSPQMVVNQILSEGRDAKVAALQVDKARAGISTAKTVYDWKLGGSWNFEDNRAVTLSGLSNLEDKTTIWKSSLSKKLPTGTTVGLGFNRTRQESVFRSSSSSSRAPNVYLDEGVLSLSQDISGNFFGVVDRRSVAVAEHNARKADLDKHEALEALVLQSIQLFWQTHVAKEQLRESMKAREKYRELVREVERKAALGSVNPGDLPRARAELSGQENLVKNASVVLLQQTEKLLTLLNLADASREDVEFVTGDVILPPMPSLGLRPVEELRKLRSSLISLDNAETEMQVAKLSGLPTVKLSGSMSYTGLESTTSASFANMTSGINPKYSYGLSVDVPIFSNQVEANVGLKSASFSEAELILARTRDELRDEQQNVLEKLKSARAVAENSIEALKNWEAAIRAEERSYRQGRLDFSQLIVDYNAYFRAESAKTKAIGDYHIALNEFAAANDKLVE